MAYFIVETSYEKCFEIFFKDELGYPNFYRMTELTQQDEHIHLTLLAPYQCKAPDTLKKITEKVNRLGLKWFQFGDNLETAFIFNDQGKLNLPAPFEQALQDALMQFNQAQQVSMNADNH